MKIYLVGGAVRDQLLGLNVIDKDWVVVGSDIAQMRKQGFHQVGNDFPVFIHPNTHEEYALARTERKSGLGYTGFICDFSPNITLEQDLARRDLTINAIAQDSDGKLIDPYGGLQDLATKTLRHVSSAFAEDPLRVLRVARFAARFFSLGFTLADDTLALMRHIAASGELAHLTPERVWKEWEKALATPRPDIFLHVLRQANALSIVLPEIDALFGVPQPPQWHPEIDTGIHTLLVTQQAALLTTDPVIRFAATVHDLGKALTPPAEYPSHKRHCQLGAKPIATLCARLKIPNKYKEAALVVCAEHSNVHNAAILTPSTWIKIFDRQDCWRKPERIEQLAIACQADHQGRSGFESLAYPQAALLRAVFDTAASVDIKPIVAAGFAGKAIRDELHQRRVMQVSHYLASIKTA